jgi:RNA polymerase sigma-70 factor (ECF subfamily)
MTFATIYEHAPSVRRYLRQFVRDDEADDVLQDTLQKAWRKLESYDPSRPLRTWLFAIARNTALDRKRREKRRPAEALAVDPPATATANRLEVADELAKARARVAELRESDREALELVASGVPYREAAERLGLPIGSLKTRVYRARQVLRA